MRGGSAIQQIISIAIPTSMSSPLIRPLDIPLLRQSMQTAPAFPHFCIDNFLEEDFATEVHDAFPSFSQAAETGKQFNAVNERKKIQITEYAKFPAPIRRLADLLSSQSFLDLMARLTGIENLVADPRLEGGGIHETNSGGRLDVHVDFNYSEHLQLYRRLNVLLYFNKDWRDEYGGILDIWDRDVKHCVGRFSPTFNRIAGFATSEWSWHGVTPVRCPPGMMRKSFAVYFYTEEPPAGWEGKKHSTVFKARPEEYWRGHVAMPAEQTLRQFKRSLASAKRAVRRLLP